MKRLNGSPTGFTGHTLLWMLLSVGVIVLLLLYLVRSQKTLDLSGGPAVRLYCAAGIKEPVEALAESYEKGYGTRIEIQFGGSGTLLANIEVAGQGDLYLAADQSYIDLAREKGLVAEAIPLAWIQPVIAVAKGNPKGIAGIEELFRSDVQVALANPDAAAVGRITKKILSAEGLWEKLEKKAKVFKPTVNELASDVALGAVDAAVVWDATARQFEELDLIQCDVFSTARQQVAVGVLNCAPEPARALRFARYLGSRDVGKPRFDASGFEGIEGDVWEPVPKVLFFSGAMLRAGIEETLKAFEKREGITIDRVYNGCGILVAQMQGGARPEAYLSCDVKFMDMVEDRFGPSEVVAENDIVLAVAKGNPKAVTGLADLAREGCRVGLGHPEKSALGYLTKLLLEEAGLEEAVRKNAAVESATADFLISQILAGGLDAVVVYRSNVMSNPENPEKHLDVIDLGIPGAMAEQPYAVARDGKHPYLMERLFGAIASPESRARFEAAGFRWRLGAKDVEHGSDPGTR